MGCCENIEVLSNNTSGIVDSRFALGTYKLVSTIDINGADYPVYQFDAGSDTLVHTPQGKLWRVSSEFYINVLSSYHTGHATHYNVI